MKIESGHFYEETQCRHYDSAIIFKQSQSKKWGQKLLLNQHVNVFAFTAGKFENALPQAQFPLLRQICEKCVNIALCNQLCLWALFTNVICRTIFQSRIFVNNQLKIETIHRLSNNNQNLFTSRNFFGPKYQVPYKSFPCIMS